MLLVEDGLVGLNRKVQEYIPEFEGEGKEEVLVSHIVTHTSGMSDKEIEALEDKIWGKIDFPPLEPTEHPVQREFLNICYNAPLVRPPGMEFEYSSSAYDVLGEIVRRVSGLSFNNFTQERIFLPLGMQDTYFSVPDEQRDRIAKQYISQIDWDVIESPCAGGCAFSTAMDMAIFGQTFLNKGRYGEINFLSPATVNAMISNQTRGISGLLTGGEIAPPWGLGWALPSGHRLRNVPALWSPQSYGHTGGSANALWIDPIYEIVGVVLSDFIREDVVWPGDILIDMIIASFNEM
jgi:CubicO group peptidase (beta-lactamase class C family)